ncbi:hypothetical protein FE257_005830 [Aspergillus nanangensis]|uniref:chitinase n=1 Tax=Aspergillus nanangensis TaxID=2582783 RepID=A0AAD4GV86_ASPNN|nr:hypothetical protein FE257_005830 [Aspergillus nanangensis]
MPASPGYRGRDAACPVACNVAGPNPLNWSAYHNLEQVQYCHQTLFYHFSLYDQVDDPDSFHRLYACTSYGPDWYGLPQPRTKTSVVSESLNATYSLGWWSGGILPASDISTISKQIRQYLKSQHVSAKSTKRHTYLFARSGSAMVGLYIGKGLQSETVGDFALRGLSDKLRTQKISSENVAMQLCDPESNNEHTFGLFASGNGTFSPVQTTMKTWLDGGCLSFENSTDITGPAILTTPRLKVSTNATRSTEIHSSSPPGSLVARAECSTVQVEKNDLCDALAARCGITLAQIQKYNPEPKFCNNLRAGQHVCCSSGTMPDFAPKPNPDGSCATYTIQEDDNCSNLAVQYGLTNQDLDNFNKNTWGWNGCENNVWIGTVMCLSSGRPPMPAPVANAVCGPQVSGTETPADTTDITGLNPCPLNACCNVWGQCGITAEFCTDTSTGAPGSAETGTNGCISNCGTTIVRGNPPEVFRSIAYFEGYALSSRECLYQDALQIDGSKYTHLHFAFGLLSTDYQVKFEDAMTEIQFKRFMKVPGPKKILSFGGWDFSALPATYNIFRQGVKPANRLTMATNIANFVKARGLDGVDIDWEYPGAPDIPGIPPDDPESGDNYLAFLVVLKNLLPGKSVSIAAASSYSYLRFFPIERISKIVDYIVYMAYDLHGQWDAGNPHAQIGCPSGNCLRSQVNLTETISSLVMITKAGVPANKVVVGVTSYGRSFAMADPSCTGPDCFFTGGPYDSQATPGRCTATGGYIADAEIEEILAGATTDGVVKRNGRVNQHYVDAKSDSDILIYDDNQYVAYMGPATKLARQALYKLLNMGGITDWATDLQEYNEPPQLPECDIPIEGWKDSAACIRMITEARTGNWTDMTCMDDAVDDIRLMCPDERWNALDAPHAWTDALAVWTKLDRPMKMSFSASIFSTLDGPEGVECAILDETSSCEGTAQCDGFDNENTGPAGYLIWNSLTYIHQLYRGYYYSLMFQAAAIINPSLDHFQKTFAPVPEPPDDRWLLLLIDLITLGGAPATASLVKSFFSKLPYNIAPSMLDNTKDMTMHVVSQSTTIAKDMMQPESMQSWTPDKQANFSSYLGKAIDGWAGVIAESLESTFRGDAESIEYLTDLISDGKFIDGCWRTVTARPPANATNYPEDSASALRHSIGKSFFAFAIPTAWQTSGRFPFVVDAGYSCDHAHDMGDYLDKKTMEGATACYNNKRYYLASPEGLPYNCMENVCMDNSFSALPGVGSMGSQFGDVTIQELIIGAVRTYEANGQTNGGKPADIAAKGTLEDLYENDITTPGYIRIPVCSAELAYRAWDFRETPDTSAANYPCVTDRAPDFCKTSTFVDQTSEGSPTVPDCMQIVRNIANTDGQWKVENAIGSHHQLVQFGSCAFGVQGMRKDGNVDFYIGAQDIVDIISESVRRFGGSGKVGAKGEMSCEGTIKGQDVEWGLYHD